MDTFIWEGDREVRHQTAMPKVPVSIPGTEKNFYVCFLVDRQLGNGAWFPFGVANSEIFIPME